MKPVGILIYSFILGVGLFVNLLGAQEKDNVKPRDSDISRLVGNWSGESICVDKVKFPACHDEQVVYHVALTAGQKDTVTIAADKIVNGKPEAMGAFDFKYDAEKQTLVSDFTYNGNHILIEFTVKDDVIEGGLFRMPDHVAVRHIKVKKDK